MPLDYASRCALTSAAALGGAVGAAELLLRLIDDAGSCTAVADGDTGDKNQHQHFFFFGIHLLSNAWLSCRVRGCMLLVTLHEVDNNWDTTKVEHTCLRTP